MADILAKLKEAINGKAPQHKVEGKTEFEFTEGKDGKLNVRDVDVKAELKLIKQQQQQILQRLNEPIETELTGSIVEIASARSLNVSAGSSYIFLPEEIRTNFKAFRVYVRWNTRIKSTIRIRFYGTSNTLIETIDVQFDENSTQNYHEIDAKSTRIRVELLNRSEVDGQVMVASVLGVV